MMHPLLASKFLRAGIGHLGLAIALAAPAAASAQDTGIEPQPVEMADKSGGLDEIVVTAQHRKENLHDVPIAISAVTAETLESTGISATNALSQMIPSVQMTRQGPSGLFFVRGVGTTNAAAGEEGANAFYVDGVYIADLNQTINNFNNIARIEVLKGPQGTLFGRNATGGLVHIITRDPGNTFMAKGGIGYANYDTLSGQVYVGGPITDNLGMDFAFAGQSQGRGWGYNPTLGKDTRMNDYWGVRSKIVWQASDAIRFKLAGDYFKSKDNTATAWRIDDSGPSQGGYLSPGGQDTTAGDDALTRLNIWGVSLTGEADLGFANLTSVTAFRDSVNRSTIDVDGGPLRLRYIKYTAESRSFQQELRLASTATEPLSWQIGLFYLRSKASNDQSQRGLTSIDVNANMVTNSYAAFGEVTYAITPTTHLTGGLRYTIDQRTFAGTQTPVVAEVLGTPVSYPRPGIDLFDNTLKYSSLTYRASLRQDITDDINAYISLNRGFKAGSFSIQALSNPPYRPQYIMAYEAGMKMTLFDRRLRLNLSAYHYDITDYQVRNVINGQSLFRNAGSVKVDGFEAEFEAAPTEHLRLFGGVSILNSRFSQFSGAVFQYLKPAVCAVPTPGAAGPGVEPGASVPGVPPTGGLQSCFGDASGNQTMLAPRFSASLGASFRFPVNDHDEIRLNALYSYNSGFTFEPDERLRQAAFHLLNASVEYGFSDKWKIEVWAKNLTDTQYYVQRQSSDTGAYGSLATPRTYGVNLKFDF